MSENSPARERLALFPLQTVLFPGGHLPLRIFEPRYVDLVRDCLRDKTGFGVVAIREGREAGAAAVPYPIGTVAEIVDWSQGADGLLNIAVAGSQRFRIHTSEPMPNQLVVAEISRLDEPDSRSSAAEYPQLRRLLDQIYESNRGQYGAPRAHAMTATQLAYRLGELLPMSLARRYEILKADDESAQIALIDEEIKRLVAASKKRK